MYVKTVSELFTANGMFYCENSSTCTAALATEGMAFTKNVRKATTQQ